LTDRPAAPVDQPPRPDDVLPSDTMPKRADVVVIGGGIIGVSTALFLAEKGVSVVLCEKGHIAGEQSSRNWGWCRNTGRDIREVPLMSESARLWEGMDARIGAPTGFRRKGIIYLCETEQRMGEMAGWLERAQPYQLGTRLLSPDEVAEALPQTGRRWVGALYTAADGQAEPHLAAPAIARAAQAKGVTILTQCAVRGLETTAGRVSAAVTERGTIACNAVVLAGGAWSSLFAGSLGLRLPQVKVQGSVLRTAPLEGGPEIAGGAPGFGLRKRADGGYTVATLGSEMVEITPDLLRFLADFWPVTRQHWRGRPIRLGQRSLSELLTPRRWALDRPSPFEKIRTLNPKPDAAALDNALKIVTRAFPTFEKAVIAQRWAGLIDVTPDMIPVISPVDALPGLVIGTGFSGHGFGIGPGAGKLLAELVTGDTPSVDPSAFRFSRFAERPRPRPSETAL
jgi:glycine/D-amino acid oxidase-like deaminating enzyme